MACTRLGSLLRPLFYFLCYILFSLSVMKFLQLLIILELYLELSYFLRQIYYVVYVTEVTFKFTS